MTRLTVITYIHPKEKNLYRCVEGLQQQDTDFTWILLVHKPMEQQLGLEHKEVLLPDTVKNKAGAYNFILPRIETDYIAFNDADDRSLPGRFKLQMDFLEREKDIDVLGGGLLINDKHKGWDVYTEPRQITLFMLFNNPMVNSTAMLRNREGLWGKQVFYNEELQRAEDYEFWWRCLQAGLRLKNHPDAQISYLMNPQVSKDREKETAQAIREEVYKYFFGEAVPSERSEKRREGIECCGS